MTITIEAEAVDEDDAVTVTTEVTGTPVKRTSGRLDRVLMDVSTLGRSPMLRSWTPGTPGLGTEPTSGSTGRCCPGSSGRAKILKALLTGRKQRSGRRRAIKGILMMGVLTMLDPANEDNGIAPKTRDWEKSSPKTEVQNWEQ